MANAAGSLPLTTSRPTSTDGTARHTAARPAPAKIRIESVDLLRGLIMVVMMLDHTRDFVHRDALAFDAANVARTFPALFFTRWITHFCAPLFVFLAGTSISIQEMRGKSKAQLSRFLITRGLWLVAVEVVVLRPLVFFNFNYAQMLAFLQVIWVIGWSMVVLAAAIHLPTRWLVGISLALIALHNTMDGIRVTGFNGPGTPFPGFAASLWILLHQQGLIFPFGFPVFVVYPFVPWTAVMAVGYGFGWWYRKAEPDRRRLFVRLGLAIVLGFVVIRAVNIYGDPSKWTTQFGGVKTFLSFLATTKYPPSLLYLMMTLGPGILFLGWAERHTRGTLANVLITFGRVPFFFYVLQWIVAHLLAVGSSARSVLLLRAAMDRRASARRGFVLDDRQAGRVSVHELHPGSGATGRRRIQSCSRLPALDRRCDPYLPVLRVVCRREGAATGLVVKLRLAMLSA